MYNVSISPRISKDINKHLDFLAKVSIKAAERLEKDFAEKIATLCETPTSNQILVFKGENTMYRKLFVPKRYLILYEIEGNNVFVDYVVDCRQDYSWLLQ